jgi:hypothetical protein
MAAVESAPIASESDGSARFSLRARGTAAFAARAAGP